MEYFFYCRDGADTGALREELTEQHWAFMDGYADGMIARGPTLTPDRRRLPAACISSTCRTPRRRRSSRTRSRTTARVYADVLVRRRNELGRTMWEYDGDLVANLRRFMVLAEGTDDSVEVSDDLNAAYRGFVADRRAELIAAGPLLAEDGTAGSAGARLLLELPGREAVDALLGGGPSPGRPVCERGGARLAVRRPSGRLTRPSRRPEGFVGRRR